MAEQNINIKNKRASFEFHILERFEAGMQLTGTEIKSIRMSKANITDAYCFIQQDELFVTNLHIAPYEKGGHFNHEPLRTRKLLLKRSELDKISKKLKNQGITLIPLRLYLSESGYAKLEIGLAQGKKLYDKREDLKKKDAKRDIDRLNKLK